MKYLITFLKLFFRFPQETKIPNEQLVKARKLLKEIYQWTAYKDTPWAKKTKEFLMETDN